MYDTEKENLYEAKKLIEMTRRGINSGDLDRVPTLESDVENHLEEIEDDIVNIIERLENPPSIL